jgi:hypothetical protein
MLANFHTTHGPIEASNLQLCRQDRGARFSAIVKIVLILHEEETQNL